MKRRGLTFFFACFMVLFAVVASGQDYVGTLNDAPYKIRVPAGWNGTLLMYAHGYGYLERWNPLTQFDYSYADAAPGMPFPLGDGSIIFMEDVLLSQGYALAGTVFSGTGWQVKEGTHELVSLAGLFNGLVGKPKRTILIGYSMGSLIALKSAEEAPIYDGVIAGCTVGAGISKSVDLIGAVALAYHTLFTWPESWGAWYDVRNDIKFFTDDPDGVFPVLIGQLMDPNNIPKFEFIRLLSGVPLENYYPNPATNWPGFVSLSMFLATEARADIEARAKGPVTQNADHVYTLSTEDRNYLSTYMSFTDGQIDAHLSAMNSQTTVTIGLPQKQYLQKYFDPSGEIRRPLLSIHANKDGLVGNYHESVLRETVKCAHNESLLLQVFTEGAGHCTFTPGQLLQAVKAMEFWLEYGTKPGSDFFPADLGFIADFTPGDWPIGQKNPAPLCSGAE